MSWHGRRVTDPKPVVRAPLEEYGVKPTKGLDPLYKGMDHAKSQLRNIEHRLQEAERHSNPTTGDDSLNIAVDRVPSYILNPTEQPTSILVDSSGKTRHLRSREELTSRKVSRQDDKYKERRQRSPLLEPNQMTERKVAWLEDDIGSTATTTTTTGYKSATGSTLWGLSSLNTRGLESTSGSKTGDGTNINFINDKDEGVLTRDGGVRGYLDLPGRWTKVDVGVPGSSRRTASGADPLASTYPPKASGAAEAGTSSRLMSDVDGGTNALAASGSSAASAPPNVNATYTLNGESSSSTSPNSSRFKHKKSLRDLEKSSDTLAKLREKVRQQKLLAASGESLAAGDKDLHITHSVNDPVVARAPARPADPPVIVRKIAAGPPIPRYQGFSEAEMKYRLPDGKMVKVSDIRRRKLKKMRKEAPLKEVQGSLITETEEKKPSKALRVIAPPKKPAKADRQAGDIITTRSWRVGAKLVLQELGPNKLPKMSDSPPSKDNQDSEKKDEKKPSSAPLSSAARAVLRDMEESGSENEDETQKDKEGAKKPHKRKRTKPPPSSGQQDDDDDKQAKVRHYDSEEVKRFMARQRSERKQRQQEESARAEQLRTQRDAQLAELYKKQREGGGRTTGAAPRSGDMPSRSATHDGRQDDGIKHSGESDKENRGGAWGEISSSESTLSGGSAPGTAHMDALNDMDVDDSAAPKAGSSGGDPLLDTYKVAAGGADGAAVPGLRSADSGLGATATRFLADSGMKVDDILSRISGRASAIKSSFAPPESGAAVSRSAASTMPTYLRDPLPMTLPNTPFSASTATAAASLNSRQQRIRALAENSSLLTHRLASEQQRLASIGHTQAATERWALPREEPVEEDAYRSRYDRMTGRNYNIYDSELPGVGSLSRPKSTHTDTGRVYQHMKSDDGMSDLSDSTLHEDELYQPLPSNKYGAGKIRLASSTVPPAGGRESTRPRPAVGRWEEPRADPYSILNVLSRRKDPLARDPYKRVGLFDDTEPEDDLQDHTINSTSDHHLSDNLSLSDDSTFTGEAPTDKDKSARQRSHHSASHHSASQRSRSPVSVSQLSEDDSSLTDYTKSHHTESRSRPIPSQRSARSANGALSHRSERSVSGRHSPTRSLKATSARSDKKTTLEERPASLVETRVPPAPAPEPTAMEEEEDQDDTLEGPQSPSMASELDDKMVDGDDAAMSVEISDVSESSDLSVADRSAGNRRAYAPGGIAYRPGLVSGRLSPGGLERRMTAELNLLESMEESVRQLTKVDRTRGISMAQQESVSLAQILKAQEHGHAQQLSAYQRDSALLTRELTNAQRTAASATENATHSIERARQETTRSLQESTMNLIATQSEAAKATAEAARQLAEVKVAASGAAANITNENTSRLIQDTAVATATAVSSVLHDRFGKRGGVGAEDHATQYSRRSASVRVSGDSYTSDTYESDFSQSVTTTRSHTRSKPAATSRPDSRVSYSMEVETASAGTSPAGTASVKTGSVVTASDLSKHTASSIATESGAGGVAGSHDDSKSESIMEEVFSGKIPDDYSIDFDTSVTEEEMEKSLREMLPSQDHRKKIKKTSSQSDLSSIASDDHKEVLNSLSTPSRRLSFEGDSFTKFQVDMVRQYMREEEIRAQHQGALLKLRERALKEKTQAELAWLEQQKTRGRDKGADEVYPLIKKKRRGLLLKLQQEQAEIRRLKEASKAASKERQFLLLQSQEIARLRQTTQQISSLTRRGGTAKVQQWLYDLESSSLELDTNSSLSQVKEKIKSRPPGTADSHDIPTEDELNFNLDDSEILGLPSPSKDLDSEGGEKKADLKALQKLRKMKLDDKFLTQREQQLLQRRLQVEGLLEWKQKLDREEAEIEAMEKAALNLTKKDKAAKEKAAKDKTTKDKTTKDTRDKADKNGSDKPATTPRTPRADTIASELDSIKEESYSESSFTASTSVIRTRRTPRTDTDIPEDVPPDSARSRGSVSSIREQLMTNGNNSSIAEDIPTARSSGKSQTGAVVQKDVNAHYNAVITKCIKHDADNNGTNRTPDSSEEANVTSSTHEEYTNETFESDAGTATVTSPAAQGSTTGPAAPPRLQLGAKEAIGAGRTAPRSPKSPLKSPIRRGSESESEDSISVAHSETASDQSDLENRIRALSEDLKRRKSEAERLKKEAKKNQKERLRQEELALKKQIEAYDKYIAEARLEVPDDVELQERQPPQIKKPTPGQKRSPPSLHRSPNDTGRVRIDSDGSRSTSSVENGGDSPGQTTPLSPITPGGPDALMDGKAPSFADSISESLMSPHITVSGHSQKKTSTPDDKSVVESRSRMIEHSEPIDEVPEEVSGLGGLEESESEVKLKLDISKTEDAPDASKPPLPDTARSVMSITEDVPTESVQQSRPRSRADESSAAHSKSEKVTNGLVSEKSIKSLYSNDFGDDSEQSASQKSSRSFTYSTSKNSRSNTSYSDEFTETQTGKSSPRRKDPTTHSNKKSREESAAVEEESIQTEEEVSEQLDAESDDEDQGVMLDIDPTPLTPTVHDPLSHISVGDRVLVGGARPGVLRFKGQVKFADGFFGGVELNKPEGTNDGSRDGVEYFHCAPKHGLFAPPEKLEALPASWKEEEPEVSAEESDISEATIHDGEEDSEKIAELRKDVTRQEDTSEPPAPKEANESIAEDVSVATTVDSELERVISSAAAAVESFGAEQLEPHSGTTSPVDTTVSDALSPREPPTPAPLEKVVDSITDGILHMVVKDSVQSAGEVAQKIVAKRQSADSTPQTVPTPAPTAETTQQTQPKQDSSSDSAVEVATQKLLTESISQMLSIYKKKQNTETPEEAVTEEKHWTSPKDGSMDPAQEAREVRQPDILTLDDAGFDPFPGLSDGFGAGKDDLDQLYDELGALTGDTDEWFDDDFGLGLKKRAPPPYPGTQQEKLDKSDSSELRLDLRRVNQEPFFAVPHRAEDVRTLTTKAVTYFWELRRFGESWADVTSPPDDYFRPDEVRAADMESGNRRAYKQLVFDITAEVLHDIYQAEEAEQDQEPCSWMPPRRCRQKYYRGRDPPTMKDLVEPMVEDQVLRLTGLKPRDKADVRLTKWSSRKKRDRVDNVLLQELVEEEPDWVDYNEDETTVKMQIADSIFDSLLVETASVFTSIAQRRAV